VLFREVFIPNLGLRSIRDPLEKQVLSVNYLCMHGSKCIKEEVAKRYEEPEGGHLRVRCMDFRPK